MSKNLVGDIVEIDNIDFWKNWKQEKLLLRLTDICNIWSFEKAYFLQNLEWSAPTSLCLTFQRPCSQLCVK